jgi:hypothetical protein
MSCAPILLSLSLLAFWFASGWAVLALVEPGMRPLRSFFLAPLVGVALLCSQSSGLALPAFRCLVSRARFLSFFVPLPSADGSGVVRHGRRGNSCFS